MSKPRAIAALATAGAGVLAWNHRQAASAASAIAQGKPAAPAGGAFAGLANGQTIGGAPSTASTGLATFWNNLFMAPTTNQNAAADSAPGWQPPTASGRQRAVPYAPTLARINAAYNLPAGLLERIAWQESRFRADIITGQTASSAGAVGMFQLMPQTAKNPGYGVTPVYDRTDWRSEATFAAQYLAALYRDTHDWKSAIAAYNWGLGNVQRHGLANAPRETVAYVNGVAGDLGLA